jgi:hypothetical protein
MDSLKDWAEYAQSLAGMPLWSKTINCNTQSFASDMLKRGNSMSDVEEILLYFTRQLKAVGMKIPEGGAYDLVQMALCDPICRGTKPMPEAVSEALEKAAVSKEKAAVKAMLAAAEAGEDTGEDEVDEEEDED